MNEQNMVIRKFEIERISIKSNNSFDTVVTSLESAIGHPDMVEFLKTNQYSQTFAEVENTIHRSLGRSGLMMFTKLDLGAILRKETGLDTPKIICFDIGNPLIMKEVLKHVPEAGSYVKMFAELSQLYHKLAQSLFAFH